MCNIEKYSLASIFLYLSLFASSAALADVSCPKMPGESWIPIDKIYSSPAATATESDPLIVDFSGDTLIYTSINRDMNSAPGRYRLQLLTKSSVANDYALLCDTGWETLPAPFRWVDYGLGAGEGLVGWRLRLFDDRTKEPGVSAPLHLSVALGSIGSRGLSSADRDAISRGPSPVSCTPELKFPVKPVTPPTVLLPKFPQTPIVFDDFPVRLKDSFSLKSGVSELRYLKGGNQLIVQARAAPDTPLGRVAIRIAAKYDGDAPYVGSCFQALPVNADVDEVAVHASVTAIGSIPVVWRVEVAEEPPLPKDWAKPTIDLTLKSADARTQTTQVSDPEYLCLPQSGKRISGPAAQSPNAFAGSTKLSIVVEDPSGALSADAHEKLISSTLTAIELWRLSCRTCNADNLAVAEADGKMFMLAPLVATFNTDAPGRANTPQGMRDYTGLFLYLNWRAGGRGIVQAHFVPIAPTDAAYTRLCAQNSPDLPKEIRRIQAALNCPESDGANAASSHIKVRILPGFTNCGDDANIIACENQASVVTLNARDYSFVDRNLQTIFGTGSDKVALMHVLLHEVGHWIGLGHIESWGNIMSTSLTESRCIDGVAANAEIVAAQGASFGSKSLLAFYNSTPHLTGIMAPVAPVPIVTSPELEKLRETPAHFKLAPAPPAN